MRVWFLKETPTIDVNCGTGTNISVWTREQKIYRITPRPNPEVNSFWMPDSHRLSFHNLEGVARFTEPLAKDGVRHVPVSWDSALTSAAAALKVLAPAQIAIIASARMTNEELWLTRGLAAALGGTRVSLVPRFAEADALLVAADRNPNSTGAKLILETPDPFTGLERIREDVRSGAIQALIVLGEDLITDAGFCFEDLAKLQLLVQSHILANPTALAAHLVLPAAAFTEKRGSMVNLTGRLQRLNRATHAPGLARDDWEILRDLTQAITGKTSKLDSIEDVFMALAAAIPAFNNLTLTQIGDLGTPITETGYQIQLLLESRG
jgi:NADH-quinone oxidoreductase subunit G